MHFFHKLQFGALYQSKSKTNRSLLLEDLEYNRFGNRIRIDVYNFNFKSNSVTIGIGSYNHQY